MYVLMFIVTGKRRFLFSMFIFLVFSNRFLLAQKLWNK